MDKRQKSERYDDLDYLEKMLRRLVNFPERKLIDDPRWQLIIDRLKKEEEERRKRSNDEAAGLDSN